MNKDKAEPAAKHTASDEEIIFPEAELMINGELITVNEITYMQGMRLHNSIQPMIDDMATAFAKENPGLPLIAGVFASHNQLLNEMILMTTGKDEDWLLSLNDEDGQALLMTFWIVNSGFFTRRLASKSMQKMQDKIMAAKTSTLNTDKSSLN